MTVAADAALTRLVLHPLRPLAAPIEVDSLDRLLLAARRERVVVPLARAVTAGLVAGADEPWITDLRAEEVRSVGMTLAGHAAAAGVLRRLHGIDVVVLKGCATAFLDRSRPVDRHTSDVDLLAASNDIERVAAALGTAPVPRYREGWARRYGHARTFTGDDGVEVDAHQRLTSGFVGLAVPIPELFADTVAFDLAGVPARALDGPGRLLHAAVSADWFDRPSLHAALDVAYLALGRVVDWRVTVERASQWGVDAFVAAGVVRCWHRLDLPDHELATWAATHRAATIRQRVAISVAAGRPRGHRLAAPLALPAREWPRYVGPILVPSRRYVTANDRGIGTRMRLLRTELGRRAVRR